MYVIYIRDRHGFLLAQVFDVSSVDIKFKLNDISTASFVLSSDNTACTYANLQEYNIVQISYIDEAKKAEKIMFDGIIRGVESSLSQTKVILNDYMFLLKKKILYVDKTYSNKSIEYILLDIASHVNSRDVGFINIKSTLSETISREYRSKKNILDLLKDLASDTYEFRFLDQKLFFGRQLGVDRSMGPDLVLFEYDINNPDARTVRTAEIEYDSDNITNAVIAEDGSDEKSSSIYRYGRIEEGFTRGKKLDILEEKSSSTREITIEPIVDDFFIADIGDLVKVYINTGSELMSYNQSLKVVEKTFKSGRLNTVNFKLSTGKTKTPTLLETIGVLKNKVKNFEL